MKKKLMVLCTALCAAFGSAQAAEQAYPSRAINMIIGFAAGGGTDVITRTFAQRLSTQLGVPVVVHNRPGADSLLASQAGKSAEPDGYTLYLASSAHAINPSLFKNPGYAVVNDYTPISMIGD